MVYKWLSWLSRVRVIVVCVSMVYKWLSWLSRVRMIVVCVSMVYIWLSWSSGVRVIVACVSIVYKWLSWSSRVRVIVVCGYGIQMVVMVVSSEGDSGLCLYDIQMVVMVVWGEGDSGLGSLVYLFLKNFVLFGIPIFWLNNERTWWILFQTRAVQTELEIYCAERQHTFCNRLIFFFSNIFIYDRLGNFFSLSKHILFHFFLFTIKQGVFYFFFIVV
jgi:hypothetical protein